MSENKTVKIIVEASEEGLSIESKTDMLKTLNILSNAVAMVSDDMIEKSEEMSQKFKKMLKELEEEEEEEEETKDSESVAH